MKNPSKFLPLVLVVVAAMLLFRCFAPGAALFSNDLPLGVIHADYYHAIDTTQGTWLDLNWLGIPLVAAPLSAHTLLVMVLGPVGYAKFAGLISTVLLGLSGWFYFRKLGFGPVVSLVSGLAIMLNATFFCFTCWGVFAWSLAIAFAMVALAFIHQDQYRIKDLLVIGICTGMSVNDGTDVGAILAALIGVYFIFRNVARPANQWGGASCQLGLIVLLAFLVSANRVYSLVATQLGGGAAAAAKPTPQEKQADWEFITQWSLPKKEIGTMVVPGLFGYRMDTPGGGNYWGEIGRGGGQLRQTGGTNYAGKLVLIGALFAVAAVFVLRSRKTTQSLHFERREVLFWSVVCLATLTFMFGKFFFTFKILYSLPLFGSFRNTGKYGVPFMIGLVILFGHGLRLLTAKGQPGEQKLLLRLLLGVGSVFVLFHVVLVAFWSGARDKILGYLFENAFDGPTSQAIYGFSQKEILLSFALLLLTCALLIFCLRAQNKTGAMIALAGLLVVDLGWADQQWIRYYDYSQRYVSNPVLEVLREKPYEHRVAGPKGGGGVYYLMAVVHQQNEQAKQWVQGISYFYDGEWLQQLFQYFNIQSPDIIQWPRMPVMDSQFARAFGLKVKVTPEGQSVDIPGTLHAAKRFWELTNTRYLLASAPSVQALQAFFTNSHFGVVKSFNLAANGDYYTAVESPGGPLALIEFSNALPRVKFYSSWRTEPDEDKALALVASEEFDPAREVVVVTNEVPGIKSGEVSAAAEAKITNYGPKLYEISLTNAAPGVLLLNSRYDRNWRVTVDGQPQTLLRCNFLMSGVAVPAAGKHEVIFRYAPDPTLFYVNAASVVLLLLLLVVPFPRRNVPEPPPKPVANPKG